MASEEIQFLHLSTESLLYEPKVRIILLLVVLLEIRSI
jgi:hypothetical protein